MTEPANCDVYDLVPWSFVDPQLHQTRDRSEWDRWIRKCKAVFESKYFLGPEQRFMVDDSGRHMEILHVDSEYVWFNATRPEWDWVGTRQGSFQVTWQG